MKTYQSDARGKEAFVREVLSPLLVAANTGWRGAVYEKIAGRERVYLIGATGSRNKAIDVGCNRLEAIVRDVFKNL